MLLQWIKTVQVVAQVCCLSVWHWFRPITQGISARALGGALLLHGVLAVLLLQWQPPVVLPVLVNKHPDQPPIIAVQILNSVPPPPPVQPSASNSSAAPQAAQPAAAARPDVLAQSHTKVKSDHPAARQSVASNAISRAPEVGKTSAVSQQRRPAAQPNPPKVATTKPVQSAAAATGNGAQQPAQANAPRLNTAAILDNYISQYQARALTSAELQAMQQSKASRQLAQAGATPKKRTTAPGRHADVAAVLDDGSQIVRLSADRCVIADAGADLRKDIHSIRGTPCPDSHSDAAMFERIMAGIGKQP